ncbi:MAG: hypothetical protein E6K65_00265 [Nitrospirae bacterium]|nr:MAG: hypothetical protein E6K65_00265 [Nitrospirota bacterium]
MPKSPDCPRCNKQLVIPDATTVKEFVKQARQVWYSAHPKGRVGRPQVPPAAVRNIARMLAEGADVPSIMKAFPVVSKTTVDRIREGSRALACIIQASHRMADGDVRDREWRAAIRRAHGVRPEWRDAIILGWSDAITLNRLIDPIDPAHPFAPQPVDPEHKPVLVRGRLK